MDHLPNALAVLVIPALDEEASLADTLDRLPWNLYRQVIVVDNGSRDRTAEIARSKGARVLEEPERGYGAACLRALPELPPGIEAVVFMDADGSDEPSEAVLLLEPLYQGRADLVLGSRTLGRSEPGALKAQQVLGYRLVTLLVWLIYRYR